MNFIVKNQSQSQSTTPSPEVFDFNTKKKERCEDMRIFELDESLVFCLEGESINTATVVVN